ncbi:MAG TPA: ribonuclease HII [Ignavibacteriales bacterium]|nr:ribonuclease HII [Ignavibacteriales bacterium]HOL80257.1 ribonuclease HII [Ignavibacteriales bacterium]HOM64538.1 ribonuclease HII [Ignavibacteriales bacterium]HPD66635.1 ribonuclease HII [Ignavibacteriales bacterium]HPP32446.1 ribonuclease HII [Ignavibacteriales bacterium]
MEKTLELIKFDLQFGNLIVGIDEAGRGPLAGPVVAAAVIMPLDKPIKGINDSKKLTKKQRAILFKEIIRNAITVKATVISNKIIDEINILRASLLAMEKSLKKITLNYDKVLIDGNKSFENNPSIQTIIKGDAKSYNIACASIVAKVVRDKIMQHYSKKFPAYQWDKNKGYPTKMHRELIKQYGISNLHRISFLNNILQGELFDEIPE